MKIFNKKLTLLTILSLGASIAQPSGIFNAAKNKFGTLVQRLPLVKVYQDRLATKLYLNPEKQTEISGLFAKLIQDTRQQDNLSRLEERVSNLAYDHTKTVEAFRAKAKSDNYSKSVRGYFDIMFAAATGITLGYAGSEFVKKDTQSESQKAMSKQRAEKLRLQRTFAVLSKSSNHTN